MAGDFFKEKFEKNFIIFLTYSKEKNTSFSDLIPKRYKRIEYIIDRLTIKRK